MEWEYLTTVIVCREDNLDVELTKFGSSGWEVYHISDKGFLGVMDHKFIIQFKREKK